MKRGRKRQRSLDQFLIIIIAVVFLIIILLLDSGPNNRIRIGAQEFPEGEIIIDEPATVLEPVIEETVIEQSPVVDDDMSGVLEGEVSEVDNVVTAPEEPVVEDGTEAILDGDVDSIQTEELVITTPEEPATDILVEQSPIITLSPQSSRRPLKEIEKEFYNPVGSSSLISNSYILGSKKYTLPGAPDAWIGSNDYRWNAALNYANANNARVTGQLKVGLGTITIATDTLAYSSTTPKIVFGGGVSGASLTFRDAVNTSDLIGSNDLVKIIDGASFPIFSVLGRLDVDRTILVDSNDARGMTFFRYSSIVGEGPFVSFRRHRGTKSTPLAVTSGDFLGKFDFQGHDGSVRQTTALFFTAVDGAVSSGSVPTAFIISTGTNSTNLPERFRINSSGNVGVSTTTPSQRLTVDGKIKIGNDTATATAGTIRWSGSDFEGFDGTQWLSLTCQ